MSGVCGRGSSPDPLRLQPLLLGLCLLAGSTAASAHPLAPALLELRTTGVDEYAVTWRTSVAQVRGAAVEPRLPSVCQAVTRPSTTIEGDALVARRVVRCPGLPGTTLSAVGLDASGLNVVVRVVTGEGVEHRGLLTADAPAFVVPRPAGVAPVFGRYVRLGGEHLLTGIDHLLFLLGLFVLVPRLRALVATVTAFTAGHGVTLSLAALGLLPVAQGPAELAIALTILLLGCELARGREKASESFIRRRPYVMAGAFGLVHGLGFAGALREIGLPPGDVPLSLLAFNLGIEAMQVAVVVAMLALAALWRRARWPDPAAARVLPAYAIGSMAVFWCCERSAALLGLPA